MAGLSTKKAVAGESTPRAATPRYLHIPAIHHPELGLLRRLEDAQTDCDGAHVHDRRALRTPAASVTPRIGPPNVRAIESLVARREHDVMSAVLQGNEEPIGPPQGTREHIP